MLKNDSITEAKQFIQNVWVGTPDAIWSNQAIKVIQNLLGIIEQDAKANRAVAEQLLATEKQVNALEKQINEEHL